MRLFVYIRRMEITINGKSHPLFFSMNAIEKIMEANKMTDFAALGEAQNPAESLKFARICAFYGIKAGYKKQGKKWRLNLFTTSYACQSLHENCEQGMQWSLSIKTIVLPEAMSLVRIVCTIPT